MFKKLYSYKLVFFSTLRLYMSYIYVIPFITGLQNACSDSIIHINIINKKSHGLSHYKSIDN
jgi:hypothetical protein